MARGEALLYGPLGWSVVVRSGAGAAAVATKAGVATMVHVISGVSISGNAAPAAGVIVQLKDGATVIEEWLLPPAAFAPIIFDFKRPYICTDGQAAELNVAALGGATLATAGLRGLTVRA